MKRLIPLNQLLMSAILLAVLLPLLAVVALSLWQYRVDVASVEDFVGKEAQASARSAGNTIDFTLEQTRLTLGRLARRLDAGTLTTEDLRAEAGSQAQIQSLVVTDAKGIIRMSDRSEPHLSLADLPHVRAVLGGAAIAYSDVYTSIGLKRRVVAVAMRHQSRAFGRGALLARMSVEELNRLVQRRLNESNAITYLTDRQGILILHPDLSLVAAGKSLATNPPVVAALQGETGWRKFESELYNAPRIAGYTQVPDAGWVVVSVRETGDTIVSASGRLSNNLSVAVVAGLLALGLAGWWGRKLTRPLEALASTMALARTTGRPDDLGSALRPAPVSQEAREYVVLAEAYNALVAELQRRFEEIHAQNEELTVQQEEIQAKNDDLQAQSEELQVQSEELQVQSEELQVQTEELQAQNKELERLSRDAQAANKLKSEFLANMSHELRTPLNSIIGYTELVVLNKRIELPEKARTNLLAVVRSSRQLLGLINDILDLSKVESGTMSLYPEPLDLTGTLSGVKATAEPLAQEKGLALSLQVAPDVIGLVADETKLRQIILNLVSNAVKFTREGAVTLSATSVGSEHVAIAVKDTGVGIAKEDQALVFEEFRQVDASTTREAGGTGLGLSISRRLARLMGGTLTLESEPGKGSTFTLELPRVPVGYDGARDRVVAPLVTPARLPAGKMIVLAIDDDPEALHLITEQLKDSDCVVIPASSGESGLALAREFKPHAITLDVMMPKMDGWMVLRALKADPETAAIPVIILSFVENKLLGFSLGASAYLGKPIDRQALLEQFARFAPMLKEGKGYVLVVEDDPDAREVYRQLLEPEGVRIVEAVDGEEAIKEMEKETPAMVVLDLMLPRLDGFGVVAWLRRNGKTLDVPVVVVTAKDLTPEDVKRLAEVRRIVKKGEFDKFLLVEDLRQLLAGARPSNVPVDGQ